MKKEHLFSITKKDFRVDTFRSGGKGGQNQNTRDTGVRITHIESGAVGESREERSQAQNKKKAFERLTETPTFKLWLSKKSFEVLGVHKTKEQIETEVDELISRSLTNGDIVIEGKENGKWVAQGV